MIKIYPSDISREEFEEIRTQLELFRKRTKPRTVDLYDVFGGILYILLGGCQWRMLPADFPKWRTVHEYFRLWSQFDKTEESSLLDRLLKEFLIKERICNYYNNRNLVASLLIHKASKILTQLQKKDMMRVKKFLE